MMYLWEVWAHPEPDSSKYTPHGDEALYRVVALSAENAIRQAQRAGALTIISVDRKEEIDAVEE